MSVTLTFSSDIEYAHQKSKPSSLSQVGTQSLSNSASFHCLSVFCVAVSQETSCLIRSFVLGSSVLAKRERNFMGTWPISEKSMVDCSVVCLNFR